MDFAYSLGVLHHVPDTTWGVRTCVSKLKPGAPFLLYLYYSLENRPAWFRLIWRFTDIVRVIASRLPRPIKFVVSEAIAACIYFPLAKTALLLGRMGFNMASFPLSSYRTRSFYSMRTDALDRFGTRLEKRFSSGEVTKIMEEAGLERIKISDKFPFWCAVGFRRTS